ncbi:unnamed protein product, partial [Meganyctiphanes norvegica]
VERRIFTSKMWSLWRYGILLIIMVTPSHQQELSSQVLLDNISRIVDSRLAILDMRMNNIGSQLNDVANQDEKLMVRLSNNLEDKLAELEKKLLYNLEVKLSAIEEKFPNNLEERLSAIEDKLPTNLEEKLSAIEDKLPTNLEEKLSAIEDKLPTNLEEKLSAIEDKLPTNLEEKLSAIEDKLPTNLEEKLSAIEDKLPTNLEEKLSAIEDKLPTNLEENLSAIEDKLPTNLEEKLSAIEDKLPTNLEEKLSAIEDKLPTNLEENLSVIEEKLLSHMEENINQEDRIQGVNEMKMNIESMEENIIAAMNRSSVLLQKAGSTRCPEAEGFFMSSGLSRQCFKFFMDIERSWDSAVSKCLAEGLVLAEPYDPVMVKNYIATKYGMTGWTWINGRGSGSYITWQRSEGHIMSDIPYWYSGQPGSSTSSSHCLLLMTRQYHMKNYPTQAFYANTCTSKYYTLCELLME